MRACVCARATCSYWSGPCFQLKFFSSDIIHTRFQLLKGIKIIDSGDYMKEKNSSNSVLHVKIKRKKFTSWRIGSRQSWELKDYVSA